MRNAPGLRRAILLFAFFAFNLIRRDVRGLSVFGLDRCGNDVLLAGPISEIDDLAALATKREEFRIGRNYFFADRTLHRAARMGNNSGVRTASVSVAASS